MKIGILLLNNPALDYLEALEVCAVQGVTIREAQELEQINGLIIVGGEDSGSTSPGSLSSSFQDTLVAKLTQGLPALAIAGGVSLLSTLQLPTDDGSSLLDIKISMEEHQFVREGPELVYVPALGDQPVQGLFHQAPHIIKSQPNVGILSTQEGEIVMARQGNFLVATFYPPATGDLRVLRYFLKMVEDTLAY